MILAFTLIAAGCSLNFNPVGANVVITGAPTVRLVSPLPNAAYLQGVVINIQALIGNAGADIARVEIAVDGDILETLTLPNSAGLAAFSVSESYSAATPGVHTVTVTAFRTDETASAPASARFTVVTSDSLEGVETTDTVEAESTESATPSASPTRVSATPRPTADNAPTESTEVVDDPSASAVPDSAPTPEPPTDAPEDTSSSGAPIATFSQGINVRSGPGTNFAPPIGSFSSGQSTDILAISPDGAWFKVRYYNSEGWIFAAFSAVTGDISALPRDPGPPPPTAAPIPPTAAPLVVATTVQVTSTPATSANLVAGTVELNPSQPLCAQTINIGFDVANLGTVATAASSTVSVNDARTADGSSQGTTVGGFPILQPGETFRVTMALTVSTYYDEDHTLTMTIDPNNAVPETVDGDNVRTLNYRLSRGDCP